MDIEFTGMRDQLLREWFIGQQSESFTPDDDSLARNILLSIKDQLNDDKFKKNLRELSATFSGCPLNYVVIDLHRPISISVDKWNGIRKTAIIKRIKSLSNLRVSIENSDQYLKQPQKKGDNFQRLYALKIKIYLTHNEIASTLSQSQQKTINNNRRQQQIINNDYTNDNENIDEGDEETIDQ